MNHKTPLYWIAATVALIPGYAYAQDAEEPEATPTLTCSVSNPRPGYFKDSAPESFTLDFSSSSVKVNSVKNNESASLYAYVEAASSLDPTTVIKSEPLSVKVNSDRTVTLTADYSATAGLAELLSGSEFYTMTLMLPEGLFTIGSVNVYDIDIEYISKGAEFDFTHVGNRLVTGATTDPADESRVEELSEIHVDFGISDASSYDWTTRVAGKAVASQKLPDETDWTLNGRCDASFTEADVPTGLLKLRPTAKQQSQRRIYVPAGTFVMTALKKGTQEVVAEYVSPAFSLRYGVKEDVITGLPKSAILASAVPAEGEVNLEIIPSGVEYLQVAFNEIPEINRECAESVKLYYNGSATPMHTIESTNESWLRLQTKGVNNSWGHVVHFYFTGGETDIVAPGDYTVEIPEGLFLFGETKEPNAKFTLNYHISVTLDFSVFPKPQINYPDFSGFTVSFSNAEKVEFNPDNTLPITIETRSGDYSAEAKATDCNGKVLRVEFDKQTNPNFYVVKIPANYVLATINGETYPNQEIEREWRVVSLAAPAIDPAPGILEGNTVFDFTLDMGEDAEITSVLDNANAYTRLLRVDDGGDIVFKPEVSYFKIDLPENAIGSSFLTLVPKNTDKPITLEPGNYVLVTCAYLYTLKGGYTPNENFYFYTVLPDKPELPRPVLTPDDDVPTASLFTLRFAQSTVVKTIAEDALSYLYALDDNGERGEAVASFKALKGSKSNEVDLVNLSGEDVLEPGVYQLCTPRGLCTSDDGVSGDYSFKVFYKKSGVVIEEADAETVDVYNIAGVCVLRGATPAQIRNLTPGVYVAGGKKYIVK